MLRTHRNRTELRNPDGRRLVARLDGRTVPVSHVLASLTAALLAATSVGCAPTGGLLDEDALAAQGFVSVETQTSKPVFSASAGSQHEPIWLADDGTAILLAGELRDADDYDLFAFGPGAAGDEWTIEQVAGAGVFRVAVFDQNLDLLAHSTHTRERALRHVLRRETAGVFIGIAPSAGASGGYRLQVSRIGGTPIPAARGQVVWCDFTGATGLTIGDRENLTFGPLAGADLGAAYADATEEIKQAIVDTVRRTYEDNDVIVLTSDETARPAGAHSVIYFGGDDVSLLGLADHLDPYNAELSQNTIVFVSRFADYQTMQLEPAEIGRMIGNSAAHELGHLLGLYHTAGPQSIMDTHTGDAWDLSGPRDLRRAQLDSEVFPIGGLDSEEMLIDSVGGLAQ